MNTFLLVISMVLILNIGCASTEKKNTAGSSVFYTPWDYYTSNIIDKDRYTKDFPEVIKNEIRYKSFITSCKGSYISKNSEDYVVGYIDGEANSGFAKLYSLDKKTQKLNVYEIRKYSNIAATINSNYFPIIEVYCYSGFVGAKNSQHDGVPAYKFNPKTNKFEEDSDNSSYPP